MAQTDLNNFKDDTRVPKTAQQVAAGYGPLISDVENAAAAQAAGVLDAAYIDYDVALEAYAARPDIEDLATRYARERPDGFGDADFMRTSAGSAYSGASGS